MFFFDTALRLFLKMVEKDFELVYRFHSKMPSKCIAAQKAWAVQSGFRTVNLPEICCEANGIIL